MTVDDGHLVIVDSLLEILHPANRQLRERMQKEGGRGSMAKEHDAVDVKILVTYDLIT